MDTFYGDLVWKFSSRDCLNYSSSFFHGTFPLDLSLPYEGYALVFVWLISEISWFYLIHLTCIYAFTAFAQSASTKPSAISPEHLCHWECMALSRSLSVTLEVCQFPRWLWSLPPSYCFLIIVLSVLLLFPYWARKLEETKTKMDFIHIGFFYSFQFFILFLKVFYIS